MTDHEQEARWACERAECLDRWVEDRARAIVRLGSVFDRRKALEQFDYRKPAQIRERLEQRVRELWEQKRSG